MRLKDFFRCRQFSCLVAILIFFGQFSSVCGEDWPTLSSATVEAAKKAGLIRYDREIKGGAHTNGAWSGGASVVLALSSFLGDSSTDKRLFEQIHYTLQGDNTITANGGYPAQHERHVTSMFAIARATPRIWSQLSKSEKDKIDLVMKAALVASAFTTNDNSPFVKSGGRQYSLDGDGNLNRGWNPNYREGMIGGVLVGVAYFGSPEAAKQILEGYDHSEFVADLADAGLSNLRETFAWKAEHSDSNAPTASQIESGVRNYALWGKRLIDYRGIYRSLLENTFNKLVDCGLSDGAGINGAGKIVAGCSDLPNKGEEGMLQEFASIDGNGPRSSAGYAYDGYRCHQSNLITLLVSGLLDREEAVAMGVADRLNVGVTDLWYKIENGYRDYSKGKARGTFDLSKAGSYGFAYVRGLWADFLSPTLVNAAQGQSTAALEPPSELEAREVPSS